MSEASAGGHFQVLAGSRRFGDFDILTKSKTGITVLKITGITVLWPFFKI